MYKEIVFFNIISFQLKPDIKVMNK